MRTSRIDHPGPLIPYDERDTVFARIRLQPGTDDYERYYADNPDRKLVDDNLRKLRGLAAPGTMRYRPGEAALVDGLFETSELVGNVLDQKPPPAASHEMDTTPATLTKFVKDASMFLGAHDVGITTLEPGFVYTHRGRRHFGEVIDLNHTHAIVLVQAMSHDYILSAPEMTSSCETARVYQTLAAACYALSDALNRLGVEARAHVDSNYRVICPPLAEMAGLGEVGRNGVLVHHRFGPAVRIGVVTVNAELLTDEPGCWGIADFCRVCGKCADNCPSGSIPKGDPVEVRGATKWPLEPDRCYKYWRTLGTDCGLCLRTCPFAKPDTTLHRLVRYVIRDTTVFNRMMLWADDLIYGRKPEVQPPPYLDVGPPGSGAWRRDGTD